MWNIALKLNRLVINRVCANLFAHVYMASRVGHKSHILRAPEPRLLVPEPQLHATRSQTTVTRTRIQLRVAKKLATRKINTLHVTYGQPCGT